MISKLMIFTLEERLSVKRQWPHQTSLFVLHGPVMIGGNEYDNHDLVKKDMLYRILVYCSYDGYVKYAAEGRDVIWL